MRRSFRARITFDSGCHNRLYIAPARLQFSVRFPHTLRFDNVEHEHHKRRAFRKEGGGAS